LVGVEVGTSYLDFWRAITFWIFADMMKSLCLLLEDWIWWWRCYKQANMYVGKRNQRGLAGASCVSWLSSLH
jgi:hypothetical protein